jgi:hypothetical protein
MNYRSGIGLLLGSGPDLGTKLGGERRDLAGRLPGHRIFVPVVGGTGRYAGARGALVIGQRSDSSVNTHTLVVGGTPGLSA